MKRYLLLLSYFLLIVSLAQAGKLKKTAGGTTTLNYLVGDGTTDNTTALQKAIDSCSKAGGGTLIIPKGTFVISPITMASNVNLYLDTLATLLGTPTMANYTVGGKLVNLIGGDSLHNVSITGKGTIDGNGAPWWAAYNANTSISRPRLVYLTKVLNLTISGITLTNSPSFHIVPNQCKNVYINGITINTISTSPNTDGIDPSNCINVYITNCTIGDGDDNIAIKSDRINGVQTPGTCQNINISNCTFLSGHGLSIGSETDDEVIGVTATNCTFNGTTNGIRIKSNIGLGGLVQNVKYSNMKMTDVENPIIINMAYSSKTGSYPTDTPSVNGFVIDSLTATGATGAAGSLVGLSGAYLKNITLSNINISAKTGLVLTDATGVTLCNVVITPKSGADIIATNVTYTTNATAAITAATSATFCAGGSVVLNANTGTGYTYQWSNNGTAISGATATSYTATAAGIYTVTVTSNYCPATSTGVKVTVNPAPAAPTVNSPVTYCVGTTATALTATGTALKWYVAIGETGSSTAPTPITTTAATTDYYVSQTTAGCESPRATITVIVNASPTATITATGPTTFCDAGNVVLNASTGTGYTYQWNVGGTAINGSTTSTYTATAAGTYAVTIKNSSNCSATAAGTLVTISATPSTSNAGNIQYITTTTATLAANTPTIGSGSWSVVSGAGTFISANSSTTTVSGLSVGANVFQWTISNGSCPTSSSSVTINVGTSPTAQTINGPTQVTTKAAGIIYSIPDNSSSIYHWSLPPGAIITSANTDSSEITVTFGTTGGTLAVTETNPYGTATSSLSILVGNAPTTQIITGADTVTANTTGVVYSVPDSSGYTYHWTLPAGATITSANTDSSSIKVSFGTAGGNVSVTQTNLYGSATSTLPVSINSATAVIGGSAADIYEVYPNPFSDYTNIIIHSPVTEQITLTVVTIQGLVCYSSSQYYTNQEFTVGSELISDGVYFVQLAYGSELKALKLVKIK